MAQALWAFLLCVLLTGAQDHKKCNTSADMTSEHIAVLVLEHGGPPALANQVAR
jgi:hypothetical protein